MRSEAHTPGPGGYAGRTATKAPGWHDLVVFDILFNNLSAGLYLAAALGELARPAAFAAIASWAYPIALAILLADFVLLVLDLGDKLRFHHMLRVFKPSSPMSLGTWCLTMFSLFLTAILAIELVVALGWLDGDAGPAWWARTLAVAGGVPFAFGSAAYKGVLFSTTAQPGWKDARWLGAYLLNSALTLGAAQMLLIAAVLDEPQAMKTLARATVWLIGFNLVPLGLLARDFHPTLIRSYTRRSRLAATVAAIVIGAVIPVGLLAIDPGTATAAAVLVLLCVSNLGVRHVIVHLPHHIAGAASHFSDCK